MKIGLKFLNKPLIILLLCFFSYDLIAQKDNSGITDKKSNYILSELFWGEKLPNSRFELKRFLYNNSLFSNIQEGEYFNNRYTLRFKFGHNFKMSYLNYSNYRECGIVFPNDVEKKSNFLYFDIDYPIEYSSIAKKEYEELDILFSKFFDNNKCFPQLDSILISGYCKSFFKKSKNVNYMPFVNLTLDIKNSYNPNTNNKGYCELKLYIDTNIFN